MLKESVNYYLARGNHEMFGCALDLSKAYDRVQITGCRMSSVYGDALESLVCRSEYAD